MGFFKKIERDQKKQDFPEEKKPHAQTNTKKRKYFEVFGDSLNELTFLRKITLFLIMIVIFQTVIIVRSINKNPLVIRVDALGNANAYKDVDFTQTISPAEVSNFTQYFLQYFTAHNFYTYDEDFTRAFKMMTPNAQRKLNNELTKNQTVDKIKKFQLKTKLIISEINIEKDSPEYINLRVRGTRDIQSYENLDLYKEEIFEDKIVLKKITRSEKTPWGLLVDNFNEELFKK